MAVSTENAAAEIQGWLRENVTGGREVAPDQAGDHAGIDWSMTGSFSWMELHDQAG